VRLCLSKMTGIARAAAGLHVGGVGNDPALLAGGLWVRNVRAQFSWKGRGRYSASYRCKEEKTRGPPTRLLEGTIKLTKGDQFPAAGSAQGTGDQ